MIRAVVLPEPDGGLVACWAHAGMIRILSGGETYSFKLDDAPTIGTRFESFLRGEGKVLEFPNGTVLSAEVIGKAYLATYLDLEWLPLCLASRGTHRVRLVENHSVLGKYTSHTGIINPDTVCWIEWDRPFDANMVMASALEVLV